MRSKIESQEQQKRNIALIDDTPANLLLKSNLISKMENMSYEEVYSEFEYIINHAKKIKDTTRNRQLIELSKQKTYLGLISYITNFLLAGEKMGTNLKKYTFR